MADARLAGSPLLEWPASSPATMEEFPHGLLQAGANEPGLAHTLDAPRIYLSPFGPKGGSKPGFLIEAKNGASFSAQELLWHAARLQWPHLRGAKVTQGVGIYRSGIQRGLPSYYIWGAKNRAESPP